MSPPESSAADAAKVVGARRAVWMALLFLFTFVVLLGLIVMVLLDGNIRTMMALSAIAYAMAAMGFLGVIAWAFLKGQFVDYEAIKDKLFEMEERQ